MDELEEVIAKKYPIVFGKVSSLLGRGSPECEDVVQDIFLCLTRGVREGQYRDLSKLSSILYCITEGKVTDFLRAKYRGVSRHKELVDRTERRGSGDDSGTGVFLPVELKELVGLLRKDNSVLTPSHRLVLGMLYEGFSLKDISKETGMSTRLVKKMLSEVETVLRRLSMVNGVSGRVVDIQSLKGWLDKLVQSYVKQSKKQGEFSLEKKDEVLLVHRFIGALLDEVKSSTVIVVDDDLEGGGISRVIRRAVRVRK